MRRGPTRFAATVASAALAAAGLVALAPVGPAAAAPVTLQFININDFHGRIDADTTKFATTIEQQRATNPNTLLLGAGDLIGASLFASAVQQDQPTIDVLNALEMDASSVGNHEFDKGFADLRDRVINGGTNATWDYLAANVTDSGGNPVLDPFTVITVGGVDVGIIGAVTQETPTLVSPGGVAGLTFDDPVGAVNDYADQLTDGNAGNGEADVIIAEYHEGGPQNAADATLEQQIAASTVFAHIVNDTSAKVDAIFTGHTHKAYAYEAPIPGESNTRPVVQTGEYGTNIGVVSLTLDDTTGVIDYSQTSASLVQRGATADTVTYPRVAAVDTIVQEALAEAAVIGNEVKGSVAADITTAFSGGGYTGPGNTYVGGTRDDRGSESTLGDLVANALRDTLAPDNLGAAEIGVVNPGGLRAELLYAPDGSVTFAEANAVLPFVNNLWTVTLTGAEFKTLLEQQWQPPSASRPFLNLGLSDNVTYTFDAALPEGSRITSITVNGEPIDPAGEYRIGTFSFLVQGGDNFSVFTQGTDARDSGLVDRDGWIAYLEAHPQLSPDFARQSVSVSPYPTSADPGTHLQFTVSKLDLTSLGSPANTTLTVSIDGVDLGDFPVTGGTATVDLTVPSGVPGGAQELTLVAEPSGTTVTIPVTIQPSIVPLSPQRILDTRAGGTTIDGQFAATGLVAAGSTLELTVAGRGGVPADASAAVLNLTATDAAGIGYVTVWPCGQPRPVASSTNFAPGAASPNTVVTDIGTGGKVCLYAGEAGVHLIADVNGTVPAASNYDPLTPARLLETREGAPTVDGKSQGEGQRAAGSTYTLQVTGRGGVPADAVAVALNVTATDSTGTGYVTVWPCDKTRPVASSVNFVAGSVEPNSVLTSLSAAGTVCLYVAEQATDLIVDVFGSFPADAAFGGLNPARLLETRPGAPTIDGQFAGTGLVQPNQVLPLQVTGRGGVPSGATGVVLNITATDATGTGFVTAFPCGEAQPNASTVNFIAGVPSPNSAVLKLGAEGKICLVTGESAAQLIVDVTAFI